MITPPALLLSALVFTALVPPPCVPLQTSTLIAQACTHTPDRDLCLSTLRTAPEGSDLRGLTMAALKVANANASAVYNHISGVLKAATNSYEKQCLTECYDNYQDAMDQIEDSLAALETRGYDDILAWIASAMNDADSCEECFRAKPGYKSPLTEMNNGFDHLCTIVIATANLLVDGEE
ncbi:hypothetical protein MLD38_015600 [Melastoma candidum]|uniref:Uncharacterized protein n=1 Tax=Melastoma candidum TaxID=119954 RepID=A0ACB9RI02_9MYRT|nr:hypothetical protein MLD38_015600 [Melastoma candidum]